MVSSFCDDDIIFINELGSRLNPKFKDLFHIEKLNSNEKIYVYKDEDQVLGFIHIAVNYEVVDLLNIIVRENIRNKGIGTMLMDYMITDLPSGIDRILLEVNESNLDAIKLYNKFNFEVINTRKNYYGDKNALIMERKLF